MSLLWLLFFRLLYDHHDFCFVSFCSDFAFCMHVLYLSYTQNSICLSLGKGQLAWPIVPSIVHVHCRSLCPQTVSVTLAVFIYIFIYTRWNCSLLDVPINYIFTYETMPFTIWFSRILTTETNFGISLLILCNSWSYKAQKQTIGQPSSVCRLVQIAHVTSVVPAVLLWAAMATLVGLEGLLVTPGVKGSRPPVGEPRN